MIGSRIVNRLIKLTVDVKSKTLSGGQFNESNIYSSLTATTGSPIVLELVTDAGAIVVLATPFWFEPVNGSLPAITEKHVIVNGSNRYEVIMAQKQGGQEDMLKVMTRALR